MFSVGPSDLKLSYLSDIDIEFTANTVVDSILLTHIQTCRELYYRGSHNASQNTMVDLKHLKKINAAIKKINQQILVYNDIEDKGNATIYINKKISQLRRIAERYQALDDQQNDLMVLQLPSYQRVFYDKFSSDLARQRDCLSLTWQYEIIPAALLGKTRFQEFFADLPLAAVQSIMNDLVDNHRLSSEIFTDHSVVAKSFTQLIRRYTLTPLRHSHAKCFLLEETSTGEKTVLKVENNPNQLEYSKRKLRKSLAHIRTMEDFLLPIYFERRARYFDPRLRHVIGRLILTKYCNQGNLFNYVLKHTRACKDHLEFVLDVVLFLGEKLEILQQSGFANTNLNGTSILVHIDEHASSPKMSLHMSNCNAFYTCDAEGRLIVKSDSTLAYTRYASAPETVQNTVAYADKIHVYQLGRFLYECVISYDPEILAEYRNEKREVDEFCSHHFKYLVFKRISIINSDVGPYLQNLIENMVMADSGRRASLRDALSRMRQIKNLLGEHTPKLDELRVKLEGLIQESHEMLKELLEDKFGANDEYVILYVKNQSKFLVLDVTKAEDIIARHRDIQNMLTHLNTKDLKRIRQTIKQLRQHTRALSCSDQNNFFRRRDNKQALEIEAVMCKIPIEQRKDIRSLLASEAPEIQKIFQSVWPFNESYGKHAVPLRCC